MLKFRTEIKIPKSSLQFSYGSNLGFIGSCFAETIADKLELLKFNVLKNPYGILYNPISIATCLIDILNNRVYDSNDLTYFNSKYVSLNHHGKFSNQNKDIVLSHINDNLHTARTFLKEASCLFISFGSAWVYEKDNCIVGNCHKIPQSEFSERLLDIGEIADTFFSILTQLNQYNPNLKVIFTVSPIRYLKYGFNENQLSKSTLHLAIKSITDQFENTSYFPSYEIMMDDLRDYRFYDRDLTHISPEAQDYIFDQFCHLYMNDKTREIMKKVESLNKLLNHRTESDTNIDSKVIDLIERKKKEIQKLDKNIKF